MYQGVLRSSYDFNGRECEILGEPDFLIKHQEDYAIRDSKISRRITEQDHPEILRQLGIYGWLYERIFGKPPHSLQVHSGTGEILEVSYDGGGAAFQILEKILSLKTAKCSGCCFHAHCWQRAEANYDVALVPGVDQNLAVVLKEEGISTIDDLLGRFDEDSLSELKRPWSKGARRVGKDAAKIIRMARAISQNKEILIQPPPIPEYPNYVMFDLEGLPPQLDELEKIYLWGMRVFGKDPSDFMPAMAGFGDEGDREGWKGFLNNAKVIFDK